jgi:hypothetical protein
VRSITGKANTAGENIRRFAFDLKEFRKNG